MALESLCLLMAFLRVITEGSAVPWKPVVFSGSDQDLGSVWRHKCEAE